MFGFYLEILGQNLKRFKEWSGIMKWIVGMSLGRDLSITGVSWNTGVRIFT